MTDTQILMTIYFVGALLAVLAIVDLPRKDRLVISTMWPVVLGVSLIRKIL